MTFNEFRVVVSEIANIPYEDIQESSSFRDDLGIDSLSMVNLIVEISEVYQLDIGKIQHSDDISTAGNMYRHFIQDRMRDSEYTS